MTLKYTALAITFFLYFNNTFSQSLFIDDFETDLNNWEIQDSNSFQLFSTTDAAHKTILKLSPNRSSQTVIIKNSEKWDKIVIEGQVLFPTNQHNYFGLIYNYQENERIDFGCIYIKGNGSYIRVNPHRDGNASRDLYEEYKTNLTDSQKILINKWIPFKAEIIGSECHFYVNNMHVPKVIFTDFEYSSGKIGFKPRFAGGDCWVDNVHVKQIKDFSFSGDKQQFTFEYDKESTINIWKAIGPFNQRIDKIEVSVKNENVRYKDKEYNWTPFNTDDRACLLAGKLCRYSTDEKYAYFTTIIEEENEKQCQLQFSSTNNLHVWVNSEYIGKIEKQNYAWYDFYKNPSHAGKSLPIQLKPGTNRILVLVEGGNYGGDGFYAHIKKD